jgi:hypothetical protein
LLHDHFSKKRATAKRTAHSNENDKRFIAMDKLGMSGEDRGSIRFLRNFGDASEMSESFFGDASGSFVDVRV